MSMSSTTISGSSTTTGECPICLSTLDQPTTVIPCAHVFCYGCIVHWTHQHNRCPVCRQEMRTLRRQQSDSTDVVDEPVPEPPGSRPIITDMGPFVMVQTPAEEPLYMIQPVHFPALTFWYSMFEMESDHLYLLNSLPPTTMFVMANQLPTVLNALENVGIYQYLMRLHRNNNRYRHPRFLNVHRNHEHETLTLPPPPSTMM